MKLSEIIASPGLIFISDTLPCSHLPVLDFSIKTLLSHGNLIILTLGTHPRTYISHPTTLVLDGYTDPLHWLQGNSQSRHKVDLSNLWSLADTIQNSTKQKSSIVVDSLDIILRQHPIHVVSMFLQRLIQMPTVSSVICGIHGDAHADQEITILRQLSTCFIEVSPTISAETMKLAHGRCDVLFKRASGKITRETEFFRYQAADSAVSRQILGRGAMYIPVELQDKDSTIRDPSAHHHADEADGAAENAEEAQLRKQMETTFSLTLRDNEKSAKESMVLPYTTRHNAEGRGPADIGRVGRSGSWPHLCGLS